MYLEQRDPVELRLADELCSSPARDSLESNMIGAAFELLFEQHGATRKREGVFSLFTVQITASSVQTTCYFTILQISIAATATVPRLFGF